MSSNKFMKIGELAERSSCLVETIRFYERKGLLPAPTRSEGNYRLYRDAHTDRLQFIRHCRGLDMSLDEIGVLLDLQDRPDQDCEGVNQVLDQHIGHVSSRIKELRALLAQLKQIRSQCHATQSTKECGILLGLSSADDAPPAKRGSHSGGCQ